MKNDLKKRWIRSGSYHCGPMRTKGFTKNLVEITLSIGVTQLDSDQSKTSKSVSEDTSNEVRESPDALLVEIGVKYDKLEKKTVVPTIPKINCVRPQ
ncbi:hypothetical protein Tco_1283135 [Tanacetum coccineum]